MLKFLKALSIFAGTIIGVGIFGLPYVASKAGFPVVVLYFLLMGSLAIIIHLLYGKVALSCNEACRLPGYAEDYLGSFWKKVAFIVIGLGLTGALLAYLIVGGNFLNLFFSPYLGDNVLLYTLLFFSLGAFLIFVGVKRIAQVELFFLVAFFALLVLFFFKAAPYINLDYLTSVDLNFLVLPYGVVIFSLWGSPLIPEVKEVLKGEEKKLKTVIITGIVLATLTYLFFIFAVFGVSGPNTSKEAIEGLSKTLGNGAIKFGFLFGIITCFTSFITLGLTLKKILWYDFNISKNLSWFLALFLPLTLFLLGLRQFINIISITGAFALGFEAVLIVFIYRAFLKKKFKKKMSIWLYVLPLIFVLGVLFEVFYLISIQ
ncbi:MAG: aromatic amino acid transport family protein [Candidatus Nealsonbacteria bacterium]